MLKPRDFPETRASLLATIQSDGTATAWHEFFDRYAPAVQRVALLRGLEAHDADDVVQQVMLAIMGHIERFNYDRDRGRFRQWVRTIAENKIRDLRRADLARTRGEERLESDCEIDAEKLWQEQWYLQDILFCLDEVAADFAPRQIEAFRLVVMEDATVAAVATQLNMSPGQIYSSRAQILCRIRERLTTLNTETEA